MSQESVKAFYQVLENDQELQERIKAVNNSADIVRIASEKGYVFTEQELEIAAQALTNEELSEKQLEAVAGGVQSDNNKVKVRVKQPK